MSKNNVYICLICRKIVNNDCICCDICDQWLHFKCSKLSKSQFYLLSQSNEPYFCYNCIEQEMPFSLISNTEFKRLYFCKINAKNFKYPCRICGNACKCSQNCIQCNLCNEWTHFKCSALTLNQFEGHVVNEDEAFLCNICYDNIFPFNKINNTELLLLNYNLTYKNVISDTDTEPYSAYSQYTSADSLNTKNINNGLSFLHLNIRSLLKNVSLLEELMISYKITPNIIGVCETKLNENINLDPILLNNYTFHFKNSMSKAGGVGIYIKNSIIHTLRTDLNFTSANYESVWLELSIGAHNEKILVGLIYRHPGSSINDFTKQFSDFLLTKNIIQNKEICIFGDININLLHKDKDKSINNYLNEIQSFGITNLIDVPTRVTNQGGTLIDHFYFSNPQRVQNAQVLLSDISDHFPLYVKLKNCNLTKTHINTKTQFHQDYSKININKLSIDASNIFNKFQIYKIINSKDSIDSKFECLLEKVKEISDKNIPTRKLSKSKLKLKSKPWITKGILKSIRYKNKLYKMLCKNNFNNPQKVKEYKTYRNKLTKIKTISKKNYFEKRLQNCNKNSAATWKVINEITNRQKNRCEFPHKLEINEESFTNPVEIVNKLNLHFSNIGKQTCLNSKSSQNSFSTSPINYYNSFAWFEVHEKEISDIIKNLSSNKANGADNISVKILKLINCHIAPIISKLINLAFQEGRYPSCLKLAKVLPIFKSGLKTIPGNYRPISLLSNINKIIEKAIYSRLYNFFTKFNILNSSQFGFREGHSTTLALSEFVESTLSSFDKGNAVCAVLLDLSKAFDCVDRKILLNKLENYGIRGKMLKLLESYLTDRKQFVDFAGYVSTCEDIEVGVPQGSVLGPLLFLIYINNLQNNTTLKVLNFADDTLLYTTLKKNTYKRDNAYLNTELENVSKWLMDNKLKLNVNKTRYMLFHSGKMDIWKKINFDIIIGSSTIKKVNNYKYLGVTIDSNLNWSEHIEALKTKLLKTIGILYKTRYYLNQNSLYYIFNSLLMSHVRYGLLCWGRASRTKINEINKLINRAIRCIHFKSWKESVSSIKIAKKILDVENMFQYELGVFMHKFKRDILPINFKPYFTSINKIHNHSTRFSETNYYFPRVNSLYGSKSLSYLGCKVWEEIPRNLKEQNYLKAFQSGLKNVLLKNQSDKSQI